jgi:hypothetical protein
MWARKTGCPVRNDPRYEAAVAQTAFDAFRSNGAADASPTVAAIGTLAWVFVDRADRGTEIKRARRPIARGFAPPAS